MRTKRALIVGATAAALLVGCGDDDDGDVAQSADTETISSAEWIKRADEICAATDRNVAGLGQVRSLDDVARFAIGVEGLVAEEVKRLRALPAPEGIGEDVARMLEFQDQEVESFDALKAAAQTGDQAQFEQVAEEASQPGDEANQIAASLGMEECEEPYG